MKWCQFFILKLPRDKIDCLEFYGLKYLFYLPGGRLKRLIGIDKAIQAEIFCLYGIAKVSPIGEKLLTCWCFL